MLRLVPRTTMRKPSSLIDCYLRPLTTINRGSPVQYDIKNGSPILKRMLLNTKNNIDKTAIKDVTGEFSFENILVESKRISSMISSLIGKQSNQKCAFLASGASSIISQFAVWMSCHVVVPLSPSHPIELIEYFLTDSESKLVIVTEEFEAKIKPIAEKLRIPLLVINHKLYKETLKEKIDDTENFILNEIPYQSTDSAMLIYTSGTTSKPKGVSLTHENIEAQISSLSSAWKINSSDTILHTLPLHHIHGLVNALLLPISMGAKVIMLPKFETETVWSHLLNINLPLKDKVSVFMAVPTIYSYLISEYDKLFTTKPQVMEHIRSYCSTKIRLMISGSAPLPNSVYQRWKNITGHKLLERYGMTEIGMALSNPLHEDETRTRLAGFTGQPLPLVQARIVSYDNSQDILFETKGEFQKGFWSDKSSEQVKINRNQETVGNLQIKGPTVFKGYFNKPEATAAAFTSDGWFITGDSVAYNENSCSFKILGRNSVDIIKCKGYKISALEMETSLLENSNVSDCAVIGISDLVLGQKILALIVYRDNNFENQEEKIDELNEFCKNIFASYSLPTIKLVENIPRNLMGKIDKKELINKYSTEG